MTKPKYGGYHIKKTQRKRPGRHSKKPSKRISKRKRCNITPVELNMQTKFIIHAITLDNRGIF